MADLKEMRTVRVDINSVHPHPKNPRIHPERNIQLIMSSLKEFGQLRPLVSWKKNIVAGNGTLESAKRLGWKHINVLIADELTEDEALRFMVIDNRTTELSEFDPDLLGNIMMHGVDAKGITDRLQDVGFVQKESANLFRGMSDDGQREALLGVIQGQTDPDVAPAPPKNPNSRMGSLYQLGRHRLLVGDATNAEHVARLVGGSKMNLLLTDPPYNVDYTGKTKDALTIAHDAWGGKTDDPAFQDFLLGSFQASNQVLQPGASFYIWHGDTQRYNFQAACIRAKWVVRECLIWVKNTLVMGRQDYHWKHEPCLYGWKDGAAHRWFSDRAQTTLLQFDRPTRSTDHPTMKPVALFEYLMNNSSEKDDKILDTFAGSGTTAIAAERLERVAFLMELDPVYADVIRKRWAEFVHGEGCDWQSLTPIAGTKKPLPPRKMARRIG